MSTTQFRGLKKLLTVATTTTTVATTAATVAIRTTAVRLQVNVSVFHTVANARLAKESG
jgi:hypothetical protein